MSTGDKDRKKRCYIACQNNLLRQKSKTIEGKSIVFGRGIKAGCKIVQTFAEELSARATLEVALQIAELLKCFVEV